jgi:hypothetical protein
MLSHIIIASLACILIHASTREGMLLDGVAWKLRRLLGPVAKPLFECLTCMCSVWGTIYWWATFGYLDIKWLWLVLGVGGINFIVDMVIGYIQFITTLKNLDEHEGI